jgi:hypothetical protein
VLTHSLLVTILSSLTPVCRPCALPPHRRTPPCLRRGNRTADNSRVIYHLIRSVGFAAGRPTIGDQPAGKGLVPTHCATGSKGRISPMKWRTMFRRSCTAPASDAAPND